MDYSADLGDLRQSAVFFFGFSFLLVFPYRTLKIKSLISHDKKIKLINPTLHLAILDLSHVGKSAVPISLLAHNVTVFLKLYYAE